MFAWTRNAIEPGINQPTDSVAHPTPHGGPRRIDAADLTAGDPRELGQPAQDVGNPSKRHLYNDTRLHMGPLCALNRDATVAQEVPDDFIEALA